MPNYYSPCTVNPSIPVDLLSDEDYKSLSELGFEYDRAIDDDFIYLYSNEGLTDEDTACIFLQDIIKESNERINHFHIQRAGIYDRMLMDSHSGFAHFITKEKIESIDTYAWIQDKIKELK